MKNFKHSRKGQTRSRSNNSKTKVDPLRLILGHLMSPQGGGSATFSRVSLEGRNVGSTMVIRRSGDSDCSLDGCSINVYVNNNIQGVNNSILVGSRVMMGDPGVEFSLGDPTLETLGRKSQDEEAKVGSVLGGWRFVFFFFSLVVAVLLFSFV